MATSLGTMEQIGHELKRMAKAVMVVMTRPNTSILYSLRSFTHSTVSMVWYRIDQGQLE